MNRLIESTRKLFGKSPRRFDSKQSRYNTLKPPGWMKNDPLRCIYEKQDVLFTKGGIVWAHIVQANGGLFEPGRNSLPATAVFSPDPFFDGNLYRLWEIADLIYKLKETGEVEADLAELSAIMSNEMERVFTFEVPEIIAGQSKVYVTTIMVDRKHLPVGLLHRGWFPFLVRPDLTQASIILPSRYWTPKLVDYWVGDRLLEKMKK